MHYLWLIPLAAVSLAVMWVLENVAHGRRWNHPWGKSRA